MSSSNTSKSWANVVVPRMNGEGSEGVAAAAPPSAGRAATAGGPAKTTVGNSNNNGVTNGDRKVKNFNSNNHRTAANHNTMTTLEDSHHQMRRHQRPEVGKSSHLLPPPGPPPAQQQQGEDQDLEGFETVVGRKKKTVQLNNGHARYRNDRFMDRYSSSRRSRTTVLEDHVPHEGKHLDKCMPPPPTAPRNQSVANGSICSETSSSSSGDCHVASVTSDENELTSTTTSNGTESAGEQEAEGEDGKPKFVAAPAPKVNPWQAYGNAAAVIASKAARPSGAKSTALSNNNVPAKTALAVADPASNRFKGRSAPPVTTAATNGTSNRIADSFKAKIAEEENWPALGDTRPSSVNANAPPLSNNVHTPEPKLDSFASSATESADSSDDSPRRNGLNPEKWPSISATDSQTMTKIMDTEVVVESTSHLNQVIARIEIMDKPDTDASPADGVNVTDDGANDSENAAGDESTTKKNKKAARPKWVPLPLPETAKPRSPRRDVRPADKSKAKSAEGDPSSPVQQRPVSRGRPQRGGLNFPRGGRNVRAAGRFYPKDPNDPRSQAHRDDYTDYPPEFTTLNPVYNMNDFIMPYVTHGYGSPGFIASPIGVPVPLETVSFVPAENNVLVKLVKKQIEYYFSEENLEKDFYLRRKMDAEGFLPVRLIFSFHRVKNMTQDFGLVLTAIRSSNELELKEDMSCVRTAVNPKKWPILDTVVPPPPVPSHPTMMMPVSSGFGIPLPKVNSQSENGDSLNPDVQEFVPKTNAATPDTLENGIDSHGINGFAKEGTNGGRYTGAGGDKVNGVKEEKTDVGGSASIQTTLLNPN